MHWQDTKKLTIAISSRALFDLDASHQVFEAKGEEAYAEYQRAHEDEPLSPGVGFALVKKLLTLNEDASAPLVEIILLSRNTADTGLRVFNSIQHHGLQITRAAFAGGKSPYPYIQPFQADLFLSANAEDVQQALTAGVASAALYTGYVPTQDTGDIRIAFDGDAVLFSDEAESIYQHHGIDAFHLNEIAAAKLPLPGGPFKGFLFALHQLQARFAKEVCPIRIALVTARSVPAHERVIRTLRAWEIRIDEVLFLGGQPKGEFLKAFAADIFFDDNHLHCASAKPFVATGHVPK